MDMRELLLTIQDDLFEYKCTRKCRHTNQILCIGKRELISIEFDYTHATLSS